MLIISVLKRSSVWYEIGLLWASITHIKSHSKALSFGFLTYEMDLSNELLNIDFYWGAAKMSQVKVWVRKNICQLGQPRAHGFEPGQSADIFLELQLWPVISLQPLDQNQCLVPHFKDLSHICLEIKAQGFWMTFNTSNLGSKEPYFNRAYVVRVCTFFVTAV